MVADIKINVNDIEVKKLLKRIGRKQRKAIQTSLNRVSNMAILMITKRTQKGRLPDGGKMIAYAKSTKKDRKNRGRQTGFKNTLFFSNIERAKIASFHDSFGVGKRKVKRPFFSIGNDEEDKLKDEFAKFFYSQVGI